MDETDTDAVEILAPEATGSESDVVEAEVIDEDDGPRPLRPAGIEAYVGGTSEAAEGLRPDGIVGPQPQTPLAWLETREQRRRRWQLAGGLALVLCGLGLFFLLESSVSGWGLLFLVPGALLLVACVAWRPYYALLLPGCALAGLGAGMIVDRALDSAMWLSWVGLGVGLLAAYAVRALQRQHPYWLPLAAGIAFIVAGALAGLDHPWQVVWHGWPLLIVVLGIAIVARVLVRGRRRSGPPARLPR